MATTMERLTAERESVVASRDVLDRRLHELDAALAEARGDTERAAYHRAVVAEDYTESHRLWVLENARRYVKDGKHSPYTCDFDKPEIERVAAQLRQEQAA